MTSDETQPFDDEECELGGLCTGGEVFIGGPGDGDYYGCPACIAREKNATIARLTDELAATRQPDAAPVVENWELAKRIQQMSDDYSEQFNISCWIPVGLGEQIISTVRDAILAAQAVQVPECVAHLEWQVAEERAQRHAEEPLVAYALRMQKMTSRFQMAGGVGAHQAYDEYERRLAAIEQAKGGAE